VRTVLAAKIILLAGAAYAAVGAIVAIAFVSKVVQRVDRAAQGAGWLFRALIAPGCAAFWPLVAIRWRRAARGPEEHA